ncbi:hypothetical protein M0R45_035301 [Rubus argutus]|uniref:Uncharacterized protein n=1 Tax=Rubus argutus TaxID=59490 RepID=A0AAW1VU80_RUBAR
MERELKDVKLLAASPPGENKDLTIYIEEGELIAVEPKEIYKFQLGPDDENLTLQIDKDLQIHIQGRDIRVVELREKFKFPLGSAREDENPVLQINEDQEIYIPRVPVKEELKEHLRLGSGSSKGENLAQQLHEFSIPAGGSGKSTDAPPATMFYLPSDDDSE